MASETRLIDRPLITSQTGLTELVEELREAGRFALDTEFAGERTYVPRLCLVQVATTKFTALIDSIAVHDMSAFWELVVDEGVQKVVHAAREDLRIAYFASGRRVAGNVFDTQLAAALVGLSQYPLSYARLVEAMEGVKLAKTETRSEWDRRPLTADQVAYARDDVRYLLPMMDRLQKLLSRLGRTEWLTEEMGRFNESRTFEAEPEETYLRLRIPRGGLTQRATAMLRAITAWRERYASDNNVPTRSVLKDETILDIVQRSPKRITDFGRIRSFPVGEEGVLGHSLLRVLDEARSLPPEELPPALIAAEDETPAQKALIDLVNAVGAAVCLRKNIAPELAITRAAAADLVRGYKKSPLYSGWRYEAVGHELSDLIAGRISITATVAEGVVMPVFQALPAVDAQAE